MPQLDSYELNISLYFSDPLFPHVGEASDSTYKFKTRRWKVSTKPYAARGGVATVDWPVRRWSSV